MSSHRRSTRRKESTEPKTGPQLAAERGGLFFETPHKLVCEPLFPKDTSKGYVCFPVSLERSIVLDGVKLTWPPNKATEAIIRKEIKDEVFPTADEFADDEMVEGYMYYIAGSFMQYLIGDLSPLWGLEVDDDLEEWLNDHDIAVHRSF